MTKEYDDAIECKNIAFYLVANLNNNNIQATILLIPSIICAKLFM